MFYTFLLLRMSNPRTPGCDSEENEFAKQGGITNGAAWLVLFPFKFSSFFISLFFLLTQSKKIASGTQWAVGCRTSTISPPTTSRSPSSSAATSTHPRRGGRDQNVEALENIYPQQLGRGVEGQQGLAHGVHVGRSQGDQGHGKQSHC